MGFNRLTRVPEKSTQIINLFARSLSHFDPSPEPGDEIDRIAKIINEHPYPDQPLEPVLLLHAPPRVLTNHFVENVLGRLFSAHSNGLKALEFFEFSLRHSRSGPSAGSLEKTLHILVRMRHFESAWELMKKMRTEHPSLLTLKSMSIVMEKIAKFKSYRETLDAFEKMGKEIFPGREFGTNEFNVLLRAFCSNALLKEARRAFMAMYLRFPPDKKSMNILLSGFKKTGDLTSSELFYHEMAARGFEPNEVTYNLRIDAFCKAGQLADALRLLEEMEQEKNMLPTLGTFTTLIHGAGIVKDSTKARELFRLIESRGLSVDTAAYNSFMSSLVRCGNLNSAASLMDEMDEKRVSHDDTTYHIVFSAMIKEYDFEGVSQVYDKMVERGFVPGVGTTVVLMRFFCENARVDLGWELWRYLVEKGNCPHAHAMELLLAGLCSRGLVQEAYDCSKQVLERGRPLSDPAFSMVKKLLLRSCEVNKFKELKEMGKKVRAHLTRSRVV